jgi:hypothetical protein
MFRSLEFGLVGGYEIVSKTVDNLMHNSTYAMAL